LPVRLAVLLHIKTFPVFTLNRCEPSPNLFVLLVGQNSGEQRYTVKLNSRRRLALVILVAWIGYVGCKRITSGVTGLIPILLETFSYLTTPESIFLIAALLLWFIQAGDKKKNG
jgi:hypothetical protein